MRAYLWSVCLVLGMASFGCGDDEPVAQTGDYTWSLPQGVPKPRVPEDNPMSEAKVELGRRLFYDVRLSGNQTQSCASCHKQELAFSDGLAKALGSTEQEHFRSAMPLTNVAYNATFGWSGPSTLTLERQIPIPMFGEEPVELGLSTIAPEALLDRLRQDAQYPARFKEAFPDAQGDPITLDHLVKAIASFERALISFDSPFDRYMFNGDKTALGPSAKRGMDLFFSERLECFHCHGGFNLSDAVDHDGLAFPGQSFHNTGLYNIDGQGGYPEIDRGLFDMTGKPEDMGRFKAPSLRNIAVTAPYFHDGSAATLEEALAHYERGGRALTKPPYPGDGSRNPYKSELIQGFLLTEQERLDLIEFFKSLTDERFLTDPRFSDPFTQDAAP